MDRPGVLHVPRLVGEGIIGPLHHVGQLEDHPEDHPGDQVHREEAEEDLPPGGLDQEEGEDQGVAVVGHLAEEEPGHRAGGVLSSP